MGDTDSNSDRLSDVESESDIIIALNAIVGASTGVRERPYAFALAVCAMGVMDLA